MRRSWGVRADLLQKANVRVIEDANIRNAVAAQGDASRPHTECPTRIALAVDAGRLEHCGMDRSGAEDLDPSRLLADGTSRSAADATLDVHLRGRFGEWKEARSKPNRPRRWTSSVASAAERDV